MEMITSLMCPACLAVQGSVDGRILHCMSCGHRWMRTSSAEQTRIEQGIYTHDYAGYRMDPVFEQAIRSLLDREIVRRLPAAARVLDIGCGAGGFLAAAAERGLRPKGIDVSEDAARLCGERGFDAVAGDLLCIEFDAKFDAVTMWDVIEHLRDPGAFFEKAHELLGTDGLFIGKVPAFGPISVKLSMWVPHLSSILLGAPDHVQYFTRLSLGILLQRTGFEVEWLRPRTNRLRGKPRGGSLRRRIGRLVAAAIRRVSGDENLYFIATAAS
jgi:SAM-dependent methyltransferase